MQPHEIRRPPLTVVPDDRTYCALHTDHGSARPLELQYHHIWPLGMGGPDERTNRALICPNGHRAVHRILRTIIDDPKDYRVQINATRAKGSLGTKTERALAWSGYQQWLRAGKPGRPELRAE